MKNTLIGLTLLSLLPITTFAARPVVQLKESCAIGSSCSYDISGHSRRIISASFRPGYYRCFTTQGDGFEHLSVQNMQTPSGVSANVEPTLASNPFMIIDNHSGVTATITYDLRNSDFPMFGNHRVNYICIPGYR